MRASENRAAAARGGWRPPTSRGDFFYFIYIFIYSIGTYMPIFKKIDRKKNRTFFILSKRPLFLLQAVHKLLREENDKNQTPPHSYAYKCDE